MIWPGPSFPGIPSDFLNSDLSFFDASGQGAKLMKEVSFQEFQNNRQENHRLIDVRETDEFEEVHVKGAELYPLSKIREGELPEEDDREVFVICRSGGRSAMACQIFEQAGFRECTNVAGGTMAAIDAGDEFIEK